jgi:hypothetical protein
VQEEQLGALLITTTLEKNGIDTLFIVNTMTESI